MAATDSLNETLARGDIAADMSGIQWITAGDPDPRELTQYLQQRGTRFITITAYELPPGQGFSLEYLWDLNGQLLGFTVHVEAGTVSSVFDICEAADWIEREIHEEFAIEFAGRIYEPLLLREGDRPGVNLHEVAP